MSNIRLDREGYIIEKAPTGVRSRYKPNSVPLSTTGHPRTPEAIRYMKMLTKLRNLVEIDHMVAQQLTYNPKDMMVKWLVTNGAYHPETQYKHGQT